MSRQHTSSRRIQVRSTVKKAARAWNITPPPEEANHDPNEDTLHFTSRCFVKVREQVDSLQQELCDLRSRDDVATSPLSQSSLEGRLHDIEERTESLEKAQDTEHAELRELLDNIKDDVAEVENKAEGKSGEMGLEVIDLDERMTAGFSEINARLDIISNATETQRNSLATRFYSTVHPLAIPAGNGSGVQQGVLGKTVAWYWKCHNSKYIDRLVHLHEFYSIDFNNWYKSSATDSESDSDSDSDSTDLTRPLPEPSSIREAAHLQPKRAVMALFSHLGLPYHVFEEQTERPQMALTERKRGKDDEVETKVRQAKQRYMGMDGVSFSGTPTNANISPTQSAVLLDIWDFMPHREEVEASDEERWHNLTGKEHENEETLKNKFVRDIDKIELILQMVEYSTSALPVWM
ncbi:hypothetical protein DL98DRAFT_542278 [Cadophora sp. DSE1049]|nr:hypothetical protein DL98DRAFT_542278 [Cadophora sp. DSE1049]